MIRGLRLVAVVASASLALVALTACTPNVVTDAQQWLSRQDGVVSADVIVDRTSLYGSSGVVRGELVENIAEDRLDLLVQHTIDYVRGHGSTELRLGYGGIDFVVDTEATAGVRETWAELTGMDDLVSAVVDDPGTHVRVLRPDTAATLEALRDVPGALEVETFRTVEDERADAADDDYGPTQRTAGSFQFLRGDGCTPSEEAWARAVVAAGYDAIDAGTVDVCGGYDLVYRPETDLSAVALEWAESQAVSPDPASELTVSESGAGFHSIAVTPGDATLIPVVAAFEAPDAPVVQYTLAADGAFSVESFEDPPSVVLDLLASSPLAARLPSIALAGDMPGDVGGETITAIGTLAELGTLVADAESLMALDPEFYGVTIQPDVVRIDLYSPPGSDPDMVAAAAALRTSPIWTTRDTYVGYLNGVVVIHEGVATIGDDYTDRKPYDDFIAAWNASATP
jgi:hypothetical protein